MFHIFKSWFCSFALLLGTIAGPACSGQHPYYTDGMFKPPQLIETDRSYMVIHLEQWIRSGRVQRIELETPEAGLQILHPREAESPNIDWLPLPVLYAAWFILDPKSKGLEIDLIAHTESTGYVPITARYDTDDTVHLVMGKALPKLLPEPWQLLSRRQLKELYAVGAIEDGDRPFLPYELHSLERALSLLSPAERPVIAQVRFVRKAQAQRGSRGLKAAHIWGQYVGGSVSSSVREISLFDTQPGHDQSLFIGEPDHPHPLPTMCFLHEIGHAIADYARYLIEEECQQQLDEYEQLEREVQKGPAQGKEALALDQRRQELARARAEHNRRHKELAEQYRRTGGPVLQAYLAVRGGTRGPTHYGRTSVEESFAESFALFRADPAALQRIYPDVYDWFAKDGHLAALRAALATTEDRDAAR